MKTAATNNKDVCSANSKLCFYTAAVSSNNVNLSAYNINLLKKKILHMHSSARFALGSLRDCFRKPKYMRSVLVSPSSFSLPFTPPSAPLKEHM